MVEILPRPCLWQCYGKRRRLSPRRQGEAFRPPAPRPALRRAGLLRRGLLEALFFSIFFSWSPTSSSWSFPERSASGGRSWWLATGAVGVSSAPGQHMPVYRRNILCFIPTEQPFGKKKKFYCLHCVTLFFMCYSGLCYTGFFFRFCWTLFFLFLLYSTILILFS